MTTTPVTKRWYFWLGAAAVLFVIGLGALVVLGDGKTATGEDDTSLLNAVAYFTWALSWLGAIISLGAGIARVVAQARAASG